MSFLYQLILKSVKQDQMLSSEKEVLNDIFFVYWFLSCLGHFLNDVTIQHDQGNL